MNFGISAAAPYIPLIIGLVFGAVASAIVLLGIVFVMAEREYDRVSSKASPPKSGRP